MDLGGIHITSQQATFAFIIAIAAFFLFLQLSRLSRMGQGEPPSFHIEDAPQAAPGSDPDQPVTVAQFGTYGEAEMWAGVLQAEGITAEVLGGRRTVPKLRVRLEDAPRVVEILREASCKEHLSDGQDVPGTPDEPPEDSDEPRPYRT